MSPRVRQSIPSAPLVALVLALACGVACAEPSTSSTPATSAPATQTATAATPARGSKAHKASSRARTHSNAPGRSTAARTGATRTTPPAAANGGPRRLDEIAIEGEIPVPQVLFITARDQRRFLDANPSRYVRTSRQVADATPTPTRVIVVGDTAHAAPAGGSK